MELQINNIINLLSSLIINDTNIIKIQKWFRGCIIRLKQLPLIMYKIKNYLKIQLIKFTKQTNDGRINSSIDESNIIQLLIKQFGNKIKTTKIRMWFDILVFDYIYGWLQVNIKISTMLDHDNIGNLATCVYAYTDVILDIHRNKSYNNGEMSNILFNKLKDKKYNINSKKDYYFIVLNKNNNTDIIINSLKGLSILTPNLNNLPFQVKWSINRLFKYEPINKKIKLFINCLQKPNPGWIEIFMSNIRTL